ncbi:hypothetical protein ACFL6I_25350, partial [candidate division KSB1 bacterium]
GKVPGNVKVNMNLKNPKGQVKKFSDDVPPRFTQKWAKHKGVGVDKHGRMKGQGNNNNNKNKKQSSLPDTDMLKASALEIQVENLIKELNSKLNLLNELMRNLGR